MDDVKIDLSGNGKSPANDFSQDDIRPFKRNGRNGLKQNGRAQLSLSQREIEAKERREEREIKSARPFCFSRLLVHKPWLVLLLGGGALMFMSALIIFLDAFKFSDSGERNYLLPDKDIVRQMDMNEAGEEAIRASLFPNSSTPFSSEFSLLTTFFIYESYEGNLLTPANMQAIKAFEDELTAREDFRKFCVRDQNDPNDICDEATYEPTFISKVFSGVDLTSQAEIDTKAHAVANDPNQRALFDKTFSASNHNSKFARSIIVFGGPLEGYADIFDDKFEQITDYSQFFRDLDDFADAHRSGTFNIFLSNREMENNELTLVAQTDTLLAGGSFFIVFIYLTFHLKSLILSSCAMCQTLQAFPMAFFFFNFVFQIKYYETLHNLSIFIILGIAADDVFVFTDAWRQSGKLHHTKGDFDKRMAFTYRRASKAMFVTSFTTAAAFLATGFSDVMPISSFGYFATILIVSNYILVITLFPSVLMIWEYSCAKYCIYERCCQRIFKKCIKPRKEREDESQIEKYGCVERFCYTKFNRMVRHFDMCFLVGIAVWMIIATYFSLQMQGLSDKEQWLKDDNPLQRSFEITANEFNPVKSEDVVTITLFWGVAGLDKSEVSRWDPSFRGTVIWDYDFDLSTVEAQQLFVDMCEALTKLEGQVLNATPSGGGLVTCFMEGFKTWIQGKQQTFPVADPADFVTRLQEFTEDQASHDYRTVNAYGFVDGQLRYASIDAVTVNEFRIPAAQKDKVVDYWNNYVYQLNQHAASDTTTAGLSKGIMAGGLGLSWGETEKAFMSSAVRGMLISGVLAFLVLVLSTCNLVVGTYATLGIAGIIVSVVSLMSFQEWQFGVGESISVVILIGFSVDYVVHLANHYVQSFYDSRHKRIQEGYGEMGISIIGGAITTFGSGAPLFLAELILFNKFAILISSTVLFSLIFSLLFFGSLAHICGPEGQTGSLKIIFCCHKCKKKKGGRKERKQSEIELSAKVNKDKGKKRLPQIDSFDKEAN